MTYRKRRIKKRPYKRFVIVCEGEKTEPIYFNNYRVRNSGLKIETPDCEGTDPKSLVDFANECINEFDLDFNFGDEIWVVFDCDSNTDEQIERAKKIARKNIKFCFSNPCFEFWYLIHFIDYTFPLDRSVACSKLKNHIKCYEKNIDVFDDLLHYRDDAIKRAENLNKFHTDASKELFSTESNPSTQVFKLVNKILKLIS